MLKLLKQINLRLKRYLRRMVIDRLSWWCWWAGQWHRRLRHGHSKATHTHSLSLQNRIDEAFYGIFEQNVANVADLSVSLRTCAGIQYEAVSAKLLHFPFKTSVFLFREKLNRLSFSLIFYYIFSPILLVLKARVFSEHEHLNVVSLSIIEESLNAGNTLV
jgi:hypothetical protein